LGGRYEGGYRESLLKYMTKSKGMLLSFAVLLSVFLLGLAVPSGVKGACVGQSKCRFFDSDPAINSCRDDGTYYVRAGNCGWNSGSCQLTSANCDPGYCIISDTCHDDSGGGGATPPPSGGGTIPGCVVGSTSCKTNCSENEVGQGLGAGGCPANQYLCKVTSCSTGGGGTPVVVSPKGNQDGASCDTTWGWACDPDNYAAPLYVDFYEGTSGTGTYLGTEFADVTVAGDSGVAAECGGYSNHRFYFPIPESLKDGASHTIYAYAINIGATGVTTLLSYSPKTITCNPTCTVSFNPASYGIVVNDPTGASVNVSSNGPVSNVTFSPGSGIISVNPTVDTVSPYGTFITGLQSGSSSITANVIMSGASRCSATAPVTVTSLDAWWQVKDADVVTNGSLTSAVPTSLYFNLVGNGGFPGVSIYGTTTTLTNANIAETSKWLAKTTTVSKRYKSDYFINAIPSTVNINNLASSTFDQAALNGGTQSSDGYIWFVYDATATGFDLNISQLSLGTKKAILIVKGAGINITGKINRTLGSGFFLVVTTGNIAVDPVVGGGTTTPDLEGIFVADGSFYSGTVGNKTDSRLWVKGTVVSYGDVNLNRDLGMGNTTTAGELFEYAPDLEFLFPASLSAHDTTWREIAP